MEKLIELLLEYKPQVHYLDKPKGIYDKEYGIGWYKREGDIGGWFSEEVIISKKFGFIKWLDDNDKIDRPKVWLKIKDLGKDYGWFAIYSGIHIECLIMLLSISDTPIDDLISYLR